MNKLYLASLSGEQKSAGTIKTYVNDITKFLEFVNKDESEITYADCVMWRDSVSSLSSSTVNKKIGVIEGYFNFLVKIGKVSNNPMTDLNQS